MENEKERKLWKTMCVQNFLIFLIAEVTVCLWSFLIQALKWGTFYTHHLIPTCIFSFYQALLLIFQEHLLWGYGYHDRTPSVLSFPAHLPILFHKVLLFLIFTNPFWCLNIITPLVCTFTLIRHAKPLTFIMFTVHF